MNENNSDKGEKEEGGGGGEEEMFARSVIHHSLLKVVACFSRCAENCIFLFLFSDITHS